MTPLEKLRHLRSLAAMATPRPWKVRREATDGFIDYQIHDGTGGHLAACSELANDLARADARYIAAAANLLPALVEFAEGIRHVYDTCPGESRGMVMVRMSDALAALERALEADHV
jgi:hypothetical protein